MMPPALAAGGRLEKRTIEGGKDITADTDDRIVGEALFGIFERDHRDVDRKPVRAEGGIEDVRDLERPALGRKHGCHSSSPIRSTIRRILSLVAGSMPRYLPEEGVIGRILDQNQFHDEIVGGDAEGDRYLGDLVRLLLE